MNEAVWGRKKGTTALFCFGGRTGRTWRGVCGKLTVHVSQLQTIIRPAPHLRCENCQRVAENR